MDAAISPFVDGISTRRGSMMALLQHGIPIATTQTQWTDTLLGTSSLSRLLLSSAKSPEAFAAETADWLGRLPRGGVPDGELMNFYGQNFSWKAIAETMVTRLPDKLGTAG